MKIMAYEVSWVTITSRHTDELLYEKLGEFALGKQHQFMIGKFHLLKTLHVNVLGQFFLLSQINKL